MGLSEIITSKNNNKPVAFHALVTGKADVSYTVPSKVRLVCSDTNEERQFSASSMLQFVDVGNRSFSKIIQHLSDSRFSSFAILETKSLLRIFITDPNEKDGKIFTCYLIGTDIELNQIYEFSGTVVADPKTQNATAIFTSAKKVPSQIDSFKLSKELHDRLSEFCFSGDARETLQHLSELYKSYASNVTNIHDRLDLHMACDLVFHSPLSFTFDGEYFHKGWMDAVIIGDTRVGKGFVAEGLHKYYGVGEVISGDNASMPGLIGGITRVEKNYVVKWGAFPRNDGGMITIDESSKLSRDDISRLNRIRSEGVAEIHKIISNTAPARVRTLFVTNTRNGKNISQFEFGIQSLLTVFKDPAAISRCDFALVVSIDEADTDSINKSKRKAPILHSQELEQQLIYWIWSRKKNEIVFSPGAVEKIYLMAIDLASTYSFDIPLIQGENIRYKLAKIAICFAGRLYSNKYKGRQLFVDVVHVELAWSFLRMIYKKPASSYYAFSMIKKSLEQSQSKDGIKNIDFYFQSFPTKRTSILQSLLMSPTITMSDIVEQTGLPRDIALEIISKLVKNKLIERRGFSYSKVDIFSTWLREEITGVEN